MVLILNKSVRLTVFLMWFVGDLSTIWAGSALGDFLKKGMLETWSALVTISVAENLDQFELRWFFHQIPVLWLISNISDAHLTDSIGFSGHKLQTLWPVLQSDCTPTSLLPHGSNGYFKIPSHEGRREGKHASHMINKTIGFAYGEETAWCMFALSPPLMVQNFEITIGSVWKQTHLWVEIFSGWNRNQCWWGFQPSLLLLMENHPPTNHLKHIRKTVKRVSEHFYCISVLFGTFLCPPLTIYLGYLWKHLSFHAKGLLVSVSI